MNYKTLILNEKAHRSEWLFDEIVAKKAYMILVSIMIFALDVFDILACPTNGLLTTDEQS